MTLYAGLDSLREIFLPRLCAVCTRSGCRSGLCLLCSKVVALSLVAPQEVPYLKGKLRVYAAGEYKAALARTILAYKSQMRIDLLPFLSVGLHRATLPLTAGQEEVYLVPIPSSLSSVGRRGFAPAEALARELVKSEQTKNSTGEQIFAPFLKRPLRLPGRSKSQKGRSESARRREISGSMLVPGSLDIRGLPCLLIDDVVTSGSTLLEAKKTLEEAGALVLGAATLAWVPRKANESDLCHKLM